ncbi:hypothetical protein UVI_02011330 [Ustilaginoidea virens]|uniref:ATP-dependent DNA ligase family profile domain-containing protein n=1 Tax=Ustilaginoidea virens TaxID=1159556 RepID=A0A1B5L3Y9_USTVR|nr:hypothetical protein UVI_02011330 [Ustilaginoidea virens]
MLLLDGQSLLATRHSERFKLLKRVIHCEEGRVQLVTRTLVDFHRRTAASELRRAFSRVITAKGEGLVLKADEPYFNFARPGGAVSGTCIKLKKEYIGTFGDVGDFAVVGAGFNAAKAKTYRIPSLKWTVFYLGCLENREEVRRWRSRPEFTVVSAVEIAEPLLEAFVAHACSSPAPLGENGSTKLRIPPGIEADAPLTVAFQKPAVFDLRCFSFDKPGNVGFWTMRFPAVTRIHFDRDYSDCVTFDELQEMAGKARETPDPDDSQENLWWIARLESADPGGRAVDAASQLTATTMPTPSPRASQSPSSFQRSPLESSTSAESTSNSRLGKPSSAASATCPARPAPASPSGAAVSDYAAKCKSPAPLSPATSTPKRRASSAPQSSPASTSKKPRQALQDVDGNASQPSASSCPLSAAAGAPRDRLRHGQEPVGSLAQDTRAREPTAASPADPVEKSRLETARTLLAMPSSPSRCSYAGGKTETLEYCKFAGRKCRLADCKILLATKALGALSRPVELMEAHGAAGAAADMDGWLAANGFGAALGSGSLSVIILVDTVAKADETRQVVAAVERARRDLPGRTRGWIAVFDWRMLDHLSIMEDENIKKKYYDGFHDPWRRWYCGIV